jgi:U4/U6.U5 tri-snRNP-associated protein 2
VTTLTKRLVNNYEEQKLLEKALAEEKKNNISYEMTEDGWQKTKQVIPFSYLSLDIPPCPLFRDSKGGLVIPQIPLFQLLSKFDGNKWNDQVTKEAHYRKQYRILKLPRYLMFHLHRFNRNNFSLEKNPTIVTFPVRNLEMKDYLFSEENEQKQDFEKKLGNCPSSDALSKMKSEELKTFIRKYGAPLHLQELSFLEGKSQNGNSSSNNAGLYQTKEEEEDLTTQDHSIEGNLKCVAFRVLERIDLFKSTKYDLVANICHESEGNANGIDVGENYAGSVHGKKNPSLISNQDDVINRGFYKIHLQFKPTGQWYELQDLLVTETSPQQIGNSPLFSYSVYYFD